MMQPADFSTHIVTPAQAGAHHLSPMFKPTAREMDSRLRGNDEVGVGERGA